MPTNREKIAAQIEKLQKQLDAPDPGPVGRVINATINLGNPAEVALAIKHGFLSPDEPDEPDESEGEPDETPRRRSYFKED
jgi:hypothetical protein